MKVSFPFLSATAIALSSLVLMGCPKKVTPVSDTIEISDEKIFEGRRDPSEVPPPPPIINDPMTESDLPPRTLTGGEAVPSALQDISFDYDTWEIRGDMTSILEGNARWIKAHPEAKIQVEGYCDARGTNEYNLVLGERRAKAVLDFMAQSGASLSQLSLISYGEESLVCSDDTEACHQKNRRAHFSVR